MRSLKAIVPALFLLATAVLVTVRIARSDGPAIPIQPTQSASATPPPRASAQGASLGKAETPSLDSDPPSALVSNPPRIEEWKTASSVKLAHDVPACSAYRVREWLKIHCSGFSAAGISQLTGPKEGSMFWIEKKPGEESSNEAMKTARRAELVFPLRRGEARIFQIAQFGEGYDGPVGWNAAYLVSAYWVQGEPFPIVTIR